MSLLLQPILHSLVALSLVTVALIILPYAIQYRAVGANA